MASILDTLRIVFGADWTGGNAVNRMNQDLARAERNAAQIGKSFAELSRASSTSFGSISPVGAKAAVQLQAMRAHADQLRNAMSGLGKEVASGSIGIDDAAKRYQAYGDSLRGIERHLQAHERATQQAERANQSFLERIGGIKGAIAAGTAAFVAGRAAINLFAEALSKVADIAQEGAGIAQLTDSFEYLTKQVLNAPDLLNQMRSAVKGTISDVDLMSGFLTVAAGTSGEWGQTLADNAPRILEIAKAASVLNPTLGDTTFFFESLAKGIKRTEFRLVDNLGLNVRVREANQRYAESIGKTVLALSAEERQIAFLNEVLRVGGDLIDQVGGKADSLVDPYQQLEVLAENTGNAFKEAFSRELIDGIQQVGDHTRDATQGAGDFGTEWGQVTGELAASALPILRDFVQLLGEVQSPPRGAAALEGMTIFNALPRILQNADDFAEAIAVFIKTGEFPALAQLPSYIGDVSRELSKAGKLATQMDPAGRKGARGFREAAKAAKELSEALRRTSAEDFRFRIEEREAGFDPLAATKEERARSNEEFIQAQRDAAREAAEAMQEEMSIRVEVEADAFDPLRESAATASKRIRNEFALTEEQLLDMGVALEDVGPILEKQAASIADAMGDIYQRAADARKEFVDLVGVIQEDMSKALVSPERDVSFVISGGPTETQAETLERYTEALERAKQAQLDLQTGFKSGGDSAEDQAEAMADAAGEIARIEQAIKNLGIEEAVLGTRHVDMALNMDNARSSFFDLLVAAGASQEAITSYGIEIGKFTPEVAEAARVSQLLLQEQTRLADLVARGQLTPGAAEVLWIRFFENTAGAAKNTVTELGNVPPAIQDIKDAADEGIPISVTADTTLADQTINDLLQREFEIGVGFRVPEENVQELARRVGAQEALALVAEQDPANRPEVTVDLVPETALLDAAREEEAAEVVEVVTEFIPERVAVDTARAEVAEPIDVDTEFIPFTGPVDEARLRVAAPIDVPVNFVPGALPDAPVPPGVPEFQRGGYTGHGSGGFLAQLHQGEYVLNRGAVDRLGRGNLDALNSGGGAGGSNQVSIVLNNYGGMGGAPALSQTGGYNNGWSELENVMRKFGVPI